MYNTPVGVRVLEGAERQLFVASLATIVELLSLGDASFVRGPLDGLQTNQKITALHTVARALLCEDEPPPELTATIEAATAAVFDRCSTMLAMEVLGDIDTEFDIINDHPSWQAMIRNACRETGIFDDLPEVDDDSFEDWDLLLECLEGRLLWDSDWAMDEQLDADPEAGGSVKALLGIDPDYFVDVPPEPSDAEADRLLAELRALTRVAR